MKQVLYVFSCETQGKKNMKVKGGRLGIWEGRGESDRVMG
jgi:hypothetical protein